MPNYIVVLTPKQREQLLQLACTHPGPRNALYRAELASDDLTPLRAKLCIDACDELTSAELARGKVAPLERVSQLEHARDALLRIAGWAEAALGYLMCKASGADKAEFRLRLGITQAAMAEHGAGLAPKPAPRTIGELRSEGYAVVVFDPDELRGADPRRIEEGLTADGFERIGDLTEEAPAKAA